MVFVYQLFPSRISKTDITIGVFVQFSTAINTCYATAKVTKYQRRNFIIQIHQFTIKIDKININLLLFYFQFPRVSCHVSRDTFACACMFFKSRGETTIFDQFCFRWGLKPKNLPCFMDCSMKNPTHSCPFPPSRVRRGGGRNRRTCHKNHSSSTRS